MRKPGLLFCLVLMLWSCKDDSSESPTGTNYTIITQGAISSRTGTISSYNSGSKELTNTSFSIDNDWEITDLNILDDYMYASTYGPTGAHLKKIDLKTGTNAGSINMEEGTLSTYFYDDHFVEVSTDKVIVSSTVREFKNPDRMLLVSKIYNKDLVLTDSVAQSHIGISLYDTEVVGSKLLYSVFTETNSYFIYTLDLSTKQFLQPIEFDSKITEILQDKDGDLMFFSSHKLRFIDTKTFSVTRTVENNAINPEPGKFSFVLDKKNDVLYCLSPASQPSQVPYYISSFNLTSNQTATYLYQNMEYVDSPLLYEAESQRIISGIPNKLKFFSKEGTVVEQVDLPSTEYKIFVR